MILPELAMIIWPYPETANLIRSKITDSQAIHSQERYGFVHFLVLIIPNKMGVIDNGVHFWSVGLGNKEDFVASWE